LVGSRTGAVTRRTLPGCIRCFPRCTLLGISGVPLPAPASSHVACGFPTLRAPAHFALGCMFISLVGARGHTEATKSLLSWSVGRPKILS
jgi:hypothetical protein